MWDWSHMNGWGGQMMGGGFGMILWLVVLVAIIWLIVRMTQQNSEQSGPRQILPKEESALDVLKKRYARGEITREQYQQMKEDLDSN